MYKKNVYILLLTMNLCLTGCNMFYSDKIILDPTTKNNITTKKPKTEIENNKDTKIINIEEDEKEKTEIKNKELIQDVFNKYTISVNNHDLLNTMNCLHPMRKDYSDRKMFYELLFNESNYNLNIKNYTIKLSNNAHAKLLTSIELVEANKPSITKQITLNLKKINGLWRIWQGDDFF